MNLYYIMTLILKIILIVLLLGLLRIYINSYKEIKIGYTAGLILFILLFLIKTVGTLGIVLSASFLLPGQRFPGYTSNMFHETLIDLIAIAVLYKITKDE